MAQQFEVRFEAYQCTVSISEAFALKSASEAGSRQPESTSHQSASASDSGRSDDETSEASTSGSERAAGGGEEELKELLSRRAVRWARAILQAMLANVGCLGL